MLTKVYFGLWFVVFLVAGILFMIGDFGMLTAVVFGFICFGLVFMGMMSVLPSVVAHRGATGSLAPKGRTQFAKETAEILREIKEAWTPEGIEVRKPRFH